MKRKKGIVLQVVLTLMLIVILACPAAAHDGPPSGDDREGTFTAEKKAAKEAEKHPEKTSRTEHVLKTDILEFSYTATAGEILVKKENTGTTGRLFFVSYEKDEDVKAQRPVTFVFNGGPGAASVWLHLGGLGPKRINLGDKGKSPPPPVSYSDNPYTWLAFTDLVFVDPVGTGFSRGEPDDEKTNREFYGVAGDVQSVADFIRRYLSKNRRWISPKFLAGESYGTTRAASLAWHLHQRYGIALNGVILISPVLDYDTIFFHPSNDLPYVLFLPSYAAAAWHHNLVDRTRWQNSISSMLDEVEEFCLNEYTIYLAQGDALNTESRKGLKKKLHDYTGLPEEFIGERNFRIDWMEFTKNILREDRLLAGRMDSTITGPDAGNRTHPLYDPSLDPLFGPFSSAMNDYVRKDLQFDSDLFYEFLNEGVNRKWDWSSALRGQQGYIDVSHTLRDAMVVNRHLRVFIASGIYDLATPYFSANYTVDHMWLKEDKARVRMNTYTAGHMIFMHREALAALTDDAQAFFQEIAEGLQNHDR